MSANLAAQSDQAGAGPQWERLWFTLKTRPWTSLAVVGIESGDDAKTVARRLAAVGNRDGQLQVNVVSAIGATIAEIPGIVAKLSRGSEKHDLTIVACDPLLMNPATIPILHAASGAVIVVRLGKSMVETARQTVNAVGRDKVMASVTVG